MPLALDFVESLLDVLVLVKCHYLLLAPRRGFEIISEIDMAMDPCFRLWLFLAPHSWTFKLYVNLASSF